MKESCACGVTNAGGGGSAAQDRFRRMVERPGDEPRGRNLLFTVFSLAPMLLAAIAVAGLAFGREAAQGAVVAELGGLVGDQAAIAIEGMIASASNFGSGVIGAAIGRAGRSNYRLRGSGLCANPQDPVESMLSGQMIAANAAARDLYRRGCKARPKEHRETVPVTRR